MSRLWVIEARTAEGALKFDCAQPESVFGIGAIRGITEDAMAKTIFAKVPDATLRGDSIPEWPRLLNDHWIARVKTW